MNESIQEQPPQNIAPPVFPLSFWQKFLYGALVIASPIFNFIFVDVMKPEWQSGKTSDYINLFLLPKASLLFFPLLAYSVLSYILLLSDSDRYARSFLVRLGIYGGVLLALQYSILTVIAVGGFPFTSLLVLFAYASPLIITRLYRWLTSRWSPTIVGNVTLGIGVIVFLGSMIAWGDPLSPFVFLAFFSGIAAPFWSFLIAGQASLWLLKHHESKFTILRGLGIFAWLAAYAYALRFNILKMYELYAALPPQPPDCYIATAAAKGHPGIVGSQSVQLENGKSMRVNRQLQRLKAAEIAIMAVTPTGHRWMRFVYDVLGKKLAAHIQNPLLADVAFLLLIPVEWISFFVLKLFIPEIQTISDRMYRS